MHKVFRNEMDNKDASVINGGFRNLLGYQKAQIEVAKFQGRVTKKEMRLM